MDNRNVVTPSDAEHYNEVWNRQTTLRTYLRKQDSIDDTLLAKSDSVASSRELAGLNDQDKEEYIPLLLLTSSHQERKTQMMRWKLD
jgi:hypothetical protein